MWREGGWGNKSCMWRKGSASTRVLCTKEGRVVVEGRVVDPTRFSCMKGGWAALKIFPCEVRKSDPTRAFPNPPTSLLIFLQNDTNRKVQVLFCRKKGQSLCFCEHRWRITIEVCLWNFVFRCTWLISLEYFSFFTFCLYKQIYAVSP